MYPTLTTRWPESVEEELDAFGAVSANALPAETPASKGERGTSAQASSTTRATFAAMANRAIRDAPTSTFPSLHVLPL